jgi:hypothetical protein
LLLADVSRAILVRSHDFDAGGAIDAHRLKLPVIIIKRRQVKNPRKNPSATKL